MNFGELIARVRRWRGIDSAGEEADTTTYLKDTINSVVREVLSTEDYPWTVKEVTIMTTPSFSDGVLLATNGLNIMTLTNTSTYTGFDYRYWGGKLKVDDEDMYYTILKTALGTASTHTIYLDRGFVGTTTASLSFTAYRDCYPLPGDFEKVEGPVRFAGSSAYELIPRQSSGFDKYHPQVARYSPSGDPTEYTVWQRRDSGWFTSSCTVTNGGYTIELDGDSPYFGVENWRGRLLEAPDGERYSVVRQDNSGLTDNVVLELSRPYGGTSGTATVVTVDPRGTWLLQLWEPPTDRTPVLMKYQSDDLDLVNNADEPAIPEQHHDVIWKGAIYYIAQYDRDIPAEERALLKQDYFEARARLEMATKQVDRNLRMRRRMFGKGGIGGWGFRLPDYIEE